MYEKSGTKHRTSEPTLFSPAGFILSVKKNWFGIHSAGFCPHNIMFFTLIYRGCQSLYSTVQVRDKEIFQSFIQIIPTL